MPTYFYTKHGNKKNVQFEIIINVLVKPKKILFVYDFRPTLSKNMCDLNLFYGFTKKKKKKSPPPPIFFGGRDELPTVLKVALKNLK